MNPDALIAELEMARDAYNKADPNNVSTFRDALDRLDAARAALRVALVGREAGRQIDQAYPFGYRSEDSEP